MNFFDHDLVLETLLYFGVEVAFDSFLEVFSFSNIDDLPFLVEEAINTWTGGEVFEVHWIILD